MLVAHVRVFFLLPSLSPYSHGVRECEQDVGCHLGRLLICYGVSLSFASQYRALHRMITDLDSRSLSGLVGVQSFYYFRVYKKDTWRLKAIVSAHDTSAPH